MAEKNQRVILRHLIEEDDEKPTLGVWKLAYADFTTAMMAFFLLLWLLGSTDSSGLKGISEYFNTPSKIAMLGGDAPSSVPNMIESRGFNDVPGNSNVQNDLLIRSQIALRAAREEQDMFNLKGAAADIEEQMDTQGGLLAEMKDQIQIEVIPEGLLIQIVDKNNRSMFSPGGTDLLPHMKEIIKELVPVINSVDNMVSVYGHTDSTPYPSDAYTNWELSSGRANSTRRQIEINGVDKSRIFKVVGLASSEPLLKDDPKNAVNRRIGIVLMKKSLTSADIGEIAQARKEGVVKPSVNEKSTFDSLNF